VVDKLGPFGVVLQKIQEQVNRLSPPHTLILDFTMTHMCFQKVGKGQNSALSLIRQIYLNRLDPIEFIPVPVDTSDHVYDEFNRLLFTLLGKYPL
jgi:hypothetical protein